MNIFVAVIPRDAASLGLYEDYVAEAAARTLPFDYTTHEHVLWRNDHVLVASFSIHAAETPIRAYTAHTDDVLISFNGVPLTDEIIASRGAWANILLDSYIKENWAPRKLGGYFNVLVVDHDTAKAYTSLTRTEPVYWAENARCTVVSNRASLAYAMANLSTRFEYNRDALISMCTIGWTVHDLTPFKGVHLLRGGEVITCRPGRQARILRYKEFGHRELPRWGEMYSDAVYSRIYDDLTQELVKSASLFRMFDVPLTVTLTGGKDSRLSAALCQKAGLHFSCVTSGEPQDRDVIVASQVAEILGVPHTIGKKKSSQDIPVVDIMSMVHQQVIQSEGTSNVYDSCYPIRERPTIQFSGQGGECYRGGYDMVRGSTRPPITSRKVARKFVDNLSLHNQRFLTPDAVKIQTDINETVVDMFYDLSFPQDHFYDYMYIVYREGRAVASNRQASAYGAIQYSPFLNDTALQLAWLIPLELRKLDYLFYNVMLRLNPRLVSLRFADSRWKFEENGPLPGTSYDEWKQREPLPPTPSSFQMRSWRLGYDGYLRSTIRDYLLHDRHHPLFEIIDYEALERQLSAPGPTQMNIVRSVLGMLGCAYLLNNDWVRKGDNVG